MILAAADDYEILVVLPADDDPPLILSRDRN